jgi:hypothetical protein
MDEVKLQGRMKKLEEERVGTEKNIGILQQALKEQAERYHQCLGRIAELRETFPESFPTPVPAAEPEKAKEEVKK